MSTSALYVWGQANTLIQPKNAPARNDFFAFLQNPHPNCPPVNRLFLEADRDNLYGPQADLLRSFLRECHARGVLVEYLDGQPKWLLSDATASIPVDVCQEVLAFNASCSVADECFNGVHFDIEPHVLGPAVWRDTSCNIRPDDFPKLVADPAWKCLIDAKQAIQQHPCDAPDGSGYSDTVKHRFLGILQRCRKLIDSANSGSKHGSQLLLSIDLGTDYCHYVRDFWLALTSSASPLLDCIAIMNYFSSKDKFVYGNGGVGGLAANLSSLPLGSHTKLVFAAETIQPPYAPDECTFWNYGCAALVDCLDNAKRFTASAPACGGFAVHHYDSYRILKK